MSGEVMLNVKRNPLQLAILTVCLAMICICAHAQNKSKGGDARAAVQTFFSLLKTRQYAALHDFLPTQLQKQITPAQLAFSLKRLDSFIEVERMDIGRVQQKGDLAVIDTTIYGRLKKPLNLNGEIIKEGRVTVQQYLFKENNHWKIATADNRTRDIFLSHHPEFNKQFQFTQPRFELRQDGRWTAMARKG
jgi:hypothetical protein